MGQMQVIAVIAAKQIETEFITYMDKHVHVFIHYMYIHTEV